MSAWISEADDDRAGPAKEARDEPQSGVEAKQASALPPIDASRASVYLHAGQVVVSAEPCMITTVLGSCVAVFLFDPIRGAGGGNHYVLPVAGRNGPASSRFGEYAIIELLRRLEALGCREADLLAKLVGGASIIQASEHLSAESLGMKNVRLARHLLSARRIVIAGEDVGGTRGRKAQFRTDTGEVWVRRI